LNSLTLTCSSPSDGETIGLGRELGRLLAGGDVVALVGELGSGKTWFTKGLALGLGVPPHVVVTSPSFSLLNEYEGRERLYHMDAYRLENLSDFLSAGMEEIFHEGGIVAVEWGDRWPEVLPDWTVTVAFDIVDETARIVRLFAHHPRSIEVLRRLDERLKRG
jgi:tRNA threonylcarbamoyladenosine biosynthesis protein TsaE